ncbi:hypothetical protein [Arthrobacter sp. H14]|uniref:hypothetical protein n=1 Tax=Arthrobacter sp. H14 TaxID=1312959 RepID=UPI00047C0006|nr:hypothetical protein [Arthrobacter sp. H14]
MIPERVVRSIEELHAVPQGSLVCAAYNPDEIYQRDGEGFIEPGSPDTSRTPSVWEFLTGSYEEHILDEGREVWVIWDASNKQVRPARPESSHDWLSVVAGRDPKFLTHARVEDAHAAIENMIGTELEPGYMSIWCRDKSTIAYSIRKLIKPGTSAADLPW